LLELRDTEVAHQDAVKELVQMKETMEKMEIERAEMVAEVEAQIERALASMAVDLEESDYTTSRPQSRLSSTSGLRSRRSSDAGAKVKALRSFATDSTLAERNEEEIDEKAEMSEKEPPENAQSGSSPPPRKKRFSASDVDIPQDGMNAVDEGISLKSDKIAQKVMEIQQKVSTDLALRASDTNLYLSLSRLSHKNAAALVGRGAQTAQRKSQKLLASSRFQRRSNTRRDSRKLVPKAGLEVEPLRLQGSALLPLMTTQHRLLSVV
jgi:hypothetical protein